jgi:hypothetical protein
MMTKAKKKRIMKYKQKQLNQMFAYLFVVNAIIVLMIVLTAMVRTSGNNKNEDGNYLTVYESTTIDDHNTVVSSANVLPNDSK